MKKQTAKENSENTAKFDFRTIKSFEDACKKEELNPEDLPEVSKIPATFQKAIINAYKLFIIFKAINDGWTANWYDTNQWKYFPWLRVKASKELYSGFGFSLSTYIYGGTDASVGSRLCTDTSEKAIYIGETFQEEYKEFFLITE